MKKVICILGLILLFITAGISDAGRLTVAQVWGLCALSAAMMLIGINAWEEVQDND